MGQERMEKNWYEWCKYCKSCKNWEVHETHVVKNKVKKKNNNLLCIWCVFTLLAHQNRIVFTLHICYIRYVFMLHVIVLHIAYTPNSCCMQIVCNMWYTICIYTTYTSNYTFACTYVQSRAYRPYLDWLTLHGQIQLNHHRWPLVGCRVVHSRTK